MNHLKPCPFCGECEDLNVEHMEGTILHPSYRIICGYCGVSTCFTDKDWIDAWNTRNNQQNPELIEAK